MAFFDSIGPSAKWRHLLSRSAQRGIADWICSRWVHLILTRTCIVATMNLCQLAGPAGGERQRW